MTQSISIHDLAGVNRLRQESRVDPVFIRRLRVSFFKHFRGAETALTELPVDARDVFASRVEFHALSLEERFDSRIDGASKLIFRTRSGLLLESVLLRAGTGRVTLCLSSQVGCAAACDFCATGRMGLAHDLTAAEILDQVVQANEELKAESRVVRNMVFMGMGEPFHNEAAVYEALSALADTTLFNHSSGRIIVSTTGVADAMVRFARRFPQVNLALSLHSARQKTREKLIPLARRNTLDLLRSTLREVGLIQQRRVMIEYLMLAGVNDSLEEATELIRWLEGIDAHVNLIPYNQVDDAPHLAGSDRPTRDAFAAVLKAAGVPTTIRYSMGQDIEAACGQLVRRTNDAIR